MIFSMKMVLMFGSFNTNIAMNQRFTIIDTCLIHPYSRQLIFESNQDFWYNKSYIKSDNLLAYYKLLLKIFADMDILEMIR